MDRIIIRSKDGENLRVSSDRYLLICLDSRDELHDIAKIKAAGEEDIFSPILMMLTRMAFRLDKITGHMQELLDNADIGIDVQHTILSALAMMKEKGEHAE